MAKQTRVGAPTSYLGTPPQTVPLKIGARYGGLEVSAATEIRSEYLLYAGAALLVIKAVERIVKALSQPAPQSDYLRGTAILAGMHRPASRPRPALPASALTALQRTAQDGNDLDLLDAEPRGLDFLGRRP